MNILGVQLLLLGFALFMVYVLYLHWKKHDVSNLMFFGWAFIWSIFVFFTLFPRVLEPLIKDLFIVRVMDLGIIGAFMVLTYLTVENNIKIKNCEEKIEKLVRVISLKKR